MVAGKGCVDFHAWNRLICGSWSVGPRGQASDLTHLWGPAGRPPGTSRRAPSRPQPPSPCARSCAGFSFHLLKPQILQLPPARPLSGLALVGGQQGLSMQSHRTVYICTSLFCIKFTFIAYKYNCIAIKVCKVNCFVS